MPQSSLLAKLSLTMWTLNIIVHGWSFYQTWKITLLWAQLALFLSWIALDLVWWSDIIGSSKTINIVLRGSSFLSLRNGALDLPHRCVPLSMYSRWQSSIILLICSTIWTSDLKVRLNLKTLEAIIGCIWLNGYFIWAFDRRSFHKSPFSLLFNFLFGWRRLWLVLNASTFFYVPFSSLFIEGTRTMWTLNGIAGRLLCRNPIGQLSYLLLYFWIGFTFGVTFQLIDLFTKPNRSNELFSFFSPIWFDISINFSPWRFRY